MNNPNSPNSWLVAYVDKEFSRFQWMYAAPCYKRWKINIWLKKRKIFQKYSWTSWKFIKKKQFFEMKNQYHSKKKNLSKILINCMKIDKKKFHMNNQYMTNKENLSKILIKFMKIQKLTLTLETSLHRS